MNIFNKLKIKQQVMNRPVNRLLSLVALGLVMALGSTVAQAARLYGVTGDGGTPPETLFELSMTDATSTFVLTLGNGEDGEEIAFNSDSGLLLHASGFPSSPIILGSIVLETIVPVTLVISSVPRTGFNYEEVTGLTYAGSGVFLASTVTDRLISITTAGVAALIGSLDHAAGGLAFVGPTLYSVTGNASSVDDLLRTINPATGGTLGSVTITLAGFTVTGGNGLATNPVDNSLWALLRVSGGGKTRALATIDPASGVATLIGITDRPGFAGIAFVFNSDTDHYQCYEAYGDNLDVTVRLDDQFGSEPEVQVKRPRLFCNPVEKTVDSEVTPIGDPTAHQTGYRIDNRQRDHRERRGDEATRLVVVSDQFGAEQVLIVEEARLLFVPSEKDRVMSALDVDHYQCYQAYGDNVDVTVRLDDQFGSEPEVQVKRPELFCNPVDKNEGGIINQTSHLTCYRIRIIDAERERRSRSRDRNNDDKRNVFIENQLDAQTLEVEEPELLCVPSEKLGFELL